MIFSSLGRQTYHTRRHKKFRFLWLRKTLLVLLLILVLRIGISWLGFGTYVVRTQSMYPTLIPGDRILTTSFVSGIKFFGKRHFALRKPRYGDIVLVKLADSQGTFSRSLSYVAAFFLLAPIPKPDYVLRRVVALPQDRVSMREYQAIIRPEGQGTSMSEQELSKKEYTIDFSRMDWDSGLPFSGEMAERRLRAKEYFLLGDNRDNSLDSRHWRTQAEIEGGVFLRYWPLSRIKRF